MTAPFDVALLRRKSTWVGVVLAVAIVGTLVVLMASFWTSLGDTGPDRR